MEEEGRESERASAMEREGAREREPDGDGSGAESLYVEGELLGDGAGALEHDERSAPQGEKHLRAGVLRTSRPERRDAIGASLSATIVGLLTEMSPSASRLKRA